MKIVNLLLMGALLVGGTAAWNMVWAEAEADLDFNIPEEDATVITSKKLTYDQEQRFALFEEDVVVTDPSLQMTSDRLMVVFDENNQARSIEAEGSVVIRQDETTAWAGKATYDIETGKIFMEQKPRIRRGRDLLEGDTITFWRDNNKMVCEPQARLVIFSMEAGPREQLFGGE